MSTTIKKMSKEWRSILETPFSPPKEEKGEPQQEEKETMPTPALVTDINRDFIDAALRRLFGKSMPQVGSISIKKPSKQGLMSEVIFITVSYDDEKKSADDKDAAAAAMMKSELPTELVAKGAIKGQEAMLAMGFANEIAWYTHVPDEVWPARPTIYFCEGTMMLLERINTDTLDLFNPLTEPVAVEVLHLLARLHATTWRDAPVLSGRENEDRFQLKNLMPRRALKPMLQGFVDGTIGDLSLVFSVFKDAALKSGDAATVAAFEECSKVDYKSKLDAMFHEMWYPDDCPDCLVLGDIKQDNMMIVSDDDKKHHGSNLVMIDFQGCGWGPAIADVFFLMNLGFTPEVFAANWKRLTCQYYEFLTTNTAGAATASGAPAATVDPKTYTLDMCLRHFRGSVASLLISCCILAKKVKDQEDKFASGSHADKSDAEKEEERARMAHERRLSEMLFVRWACGMVALGVNADVEKLPASK